jgi:hypothetical protein
MGNMKKTDERGFVYPVILIICFGLFYTIMSASEMMVSERKFLQQEGSVKEDGTLLMAGARYAVFHINSDKEYVYPAELQFHHDNRSVVCYIDTTDSLTFHVILETSSSSGRKKKAAFFYLKESNNITDWTEEKG